MEIELAEPYRSKWRKGYLRINPENRHYVDLYNSNDDRTSTPYSRYLMSVKMGVLVPDHLEVDHIDDDKTNDAHINLQLLTPEQNKQKEALRRASNVEIFYVVCAYCNNSFLITRRDYNSRVSLKVEYMCCTVSCARKHAYHVTRKTNNQHVLRQLNPAIVLTDEQTQRLGALKEAGHSQRLVAGLMGISRHAVQKYWTRV